MTAHELARKLLAGPDLKVVISDNGDYTEIVSLEPSKEWHNEPVPNTWPWPAKPVEPKHTDVIRLLRVP